MTKIKVKPPISGRIAQIKAKQSNSKQRKINHPNDRLKERKQPILNEGEHSNGVRNVIEQNRKTMYNESPQTKK